MKCFTLSDMILYQDLPKYSTLHTNFLSNRSDQWSQLWESSEQWKNQPRRRLVSLENIRMAEENSVVCGASMDFASPQETTYPILFCLGCLFVTEWLIAWLTQRYSPVFSCIYHSFCFLPLRLYRLFLLSV